MKCLSASFHFLLAGLVRSNAAQMPLLSSHAAQIKVHEPGWPSVSRDLYKNVIPLERNFSRNRSNLRLILRVFKALSFSSLLSML